VNTEAALKEKLELQLKEIQTTLVNHYNDNPHLGVLAGISGISLFHFYYSKYLGNDTYFDDGAEILNESINRINEGYTLLTYCSGIAGAGWVFDHLIEEEFVEIDTDDLLPDLDVPFYNTMINHIKKGDYDFLHGAIGYGFYFLKRFKNTKSKDLKERYTNYLLALVSELEILSEKDENGIKWPQVNHKKSEKPEYNFGLSHGIPGILNFLSRLHEFKEFKNKVASLLKEGVAYIVSFENSNNDAFSLFPNNVIGCDRGIDSRLAWCYGDLGVGTSLMIAAKTLKDDQLYQKAIQILKHSANRTSIKDTMVKDAGLCHGSYGNAQIFNRLYRETKDNVFKEAAEHWITQESFNRCRRNWHGHYILSIRF